MIDLESAKFLPKALVGEILSPPNWPGNERRVLQ